MSKDYCEGGHHYYVAETGLDSEGQIVVILVCTSCGNPIKHEFKVNTTVQLWSQIKDK